MSTSTVPSSVRLANDIAVQFTHRPQEEAATEIAAHIHQFWEPRMTTALLAHLDAGGVGLEPLAVAAAEVLRART